MKFTLSILTLILFALPSCGVMTKMKKDIDSSSKAINDNRNIVNESSRVIQRNYETVDRSTQSIDQNRLTIDESSRTIRANGEVVMASTQAIQANERTVAASTNAILQNAKAIEESTEMISSLKPEPEVIMAAIPVILVLVASPFLLMLFFLWRIDRRMKKFMMMKKEGLD